MSKSVFILVVLSVLSFSKDRKTNSIFLNETIPESLNGNVKQLTITYSDDDFPEGDHTVVDFDVQGDVINEKREFRGNTVQVKYIAKRNIYGKKMEMVGYLIDLTKYPIGFNDNTKKVEDIDTAKKFKEIYLYDKDEHISQFILNRFDPASGHYLYKYNSDGNIIESDYYINPKLLLDITKFKYDNKHHLIELDKFTTKNFLAYRVHYFYKSFDPKNNWIKMVAQSEGFYPTPKDMRTYTVNREITYY